jgi:hypothetical protein
VTIKLSEAQIRGQVKAVLDKIPETRVIGIHSPVAWVGPASIRVNAIDVDIVFCPSTLAVRETLAGHSPSASTLALLTDRSDVELGVDVLTRLAKRRLFRIEAWRIAMDLFGAREVDARLARESWIWESLVEGAPAEGYAPVPSGVLDAETVWKTILCGQLGMSDEQPDAQTLLQGTLDSEALSRFERAPAAMREGVAARVALTAGPVGSAIMRALASGRGADALALGLACRVLFSVAPQREPKLQEAAVRLEPLLGGHSLEPQQGIAWADAAEAVVRKQVEASGPQAATSWFDRTDTLLRELRADEFVHQSDVLVSGFEQRLENYVSQLTAALAEPSSSLAALDTAAAVVLAHDHALWRTDRAEAVRMSLRLAGWVRRPRVVAASFAEAVLAYAREGAMVDRARGVLADGDSLPAATEVYRRLADEVTAVREQENRHFANLLADWTALGSSDERIVPVEAVLDRVVAPLAREAPVLFIVADGMSLPVYCELLNDLAALGWVEVEEGDQPVRRPAVAALPTITEVSRASLLCGALRSGPAGVERNGFSSSPALVAISRPAFPPLLFHKGDLVQAGGGGLAETVRTEIARTTRQIVGVVINAIDDHLAKGDQLRVHWGTESIRPLRWVLDAAREAGRVVVLTSDHGHVLEPGLTHRPNDSGGHRHRLDDGKPAADEVALRGPRVLAPGGAVIVPWSERVRYGVRQNGYHGGASPQEVVVPLAVLRTAEQSLRGWTELPPTIPVWWDVEEPFTGRPTTPPIVPLRVMTPKKQTELFAPTPGSAPSAEAAPWVDRLLASPVWAAQKAVAGRLSLPDDRIRQCLVALDERGGKLTRTALARALGVAPLRVSGMMTALRRLLNVDGYAVLTFDETSDTVELNRALLDTQFGLERSA